MTETNEPGAEQARQRVTLIGTAFDAKGGAILETDQGRVIYVLGLDAWPAAVVGHRVQATGIAGNEKLIPDPVVGADGGISHMCLVLRGKVPADQRGEKLTRIGTPGDTPVGLFAARAAITRDADLAEGTTSVWHDVMFQMTSAQEEGMEMEGT